MQKLSIEQVAILTVLNEFDLNEEYDENVERISNLDRLEEFTEENGLEPKEIDNIIEELQYWGYIKEDYSLTVPGRQYLRTGYDGGEQKIEVKSADKSEKLENDVAITNNYSITLFEELANITGISVDFSDITKTLGSLLSMIPNLSKKK